METVETGKSTRYFLSTPMSGGFAEIRAAIVDALRPTGAVALLLENMSLTRGVTEVVFDDIKSASFVIADLTGSNQWVLYEVGLAHGMQKPVLLIAQNLDSVPTPLKTQYLILTYKPDDLRQLKTSVMAWVRRFMTRTPQQTPERSHAG